jgi:hypothetical protein
VGQPIVAAAGFQPALSARDIPVYADWGYFSQK